MTSQLREMLEKNKNLSHLQVRFLYKHIFLFQPGFVQSRDHFLKLKNQLLCIEGMSQKQNLSRKVKLLKKNTIQIRSKKPRLVLLRYASTIIFTSRTVQPPNYPDSW